MSKEEFEAFVRSRLLEIYEALKEYYPETRYLTMSITDGWVSFNNDYWNQKTSKRIEWYGDIEWCEQ